MQLFNRRLTVAALVLCAAPTQVTPADILGYRTQDSIENIGSYYIHGRPTHANGAQRVWIDYIATLSGPREAPIAADMLTVTTDFAVTATAAIGENCIAVGGQVTTGSTTQTIVEIWSLRKAEVETVVSASDQQRTHKINVGSVASQTRVLSLVDAPGKKGVRRLVKLRGKPSSLLVQFHDSGDLYELDHSNAPATLSLRLSPLAGNGVPQVAALNDKRFKWLSGRRHSDQGCMYVFQAPEEPGNGAQSPFCFTLFDADCDGSIDTWQHLELSHLRELHDSGYVEIELSSRW